jgi:hypothetical protein
MLPVDVRQAESLKKLTLAPDLLRFTVVLDVTLTGIFESLSKVIDWATQTFEKERPAPFQLIFVGVLVPLVVCPATEKVGVSP